MRELSEVRPFENDFELVHMPAVRMIGKETRSGGKLGNAAPALWDATFASGACNALDALPHVTAESIFGHTCKYDPATDTFVYMVCVMSPAGTPVPEGFTFRDLTETLCARGVLGEDTMQTVERAKAAGYAPNWATCGWNAEMYFRQETDTAPKDCTPWHWLVPVKRA